MFKRVSLYFLAGAAGIICAFLLSGVFFITFVTGNGMSPDMKDGDVLLVNKHSYGEKKPETGDVVAVRNYVYGEEGEGNIIIRRVAGTEGDTVEIKDNIFYLNGKPYDRYMKEAASMDELKKLRIEEGEIFVLSDNRKATMDSRDKAIGIVDMGDCLGKVCFK